MDKMLFNRKGLSFVEVIVSAMAVAIIAGGVVAAYLNAARITAIAYHKIAALTLAQSHMEAELHNNPSVGTVNPDMANFLTVDSARYNTAHSVTTPNSRIRVDVTWDE